MSESEKFVQQSNVLTEVELRDDNEDESDT
jgi:hypothetical protein